MAKTLVIKGANYSANALAVVSFDEDTPCTGISLTESAYTFTGYTPVTAEYTVTPADTTDAVTWASSDTSVATVSDGVITPVGLGTATITVTCGNFSDTATVTVALAYIPSFQFLYLGIGTQATYTNTAVNGRMIAFGSGVQATEYLCLATSSGQDIPAIKLPPNTASVKISASDPTKLYNGTDMFVAWAKDEWCGNNTYPTGIKKISVEDGYNPRTSSEKTFDVPEGADSLLLGSRIYPVPAEGTDPTEYATGTIGLTIEFLPAAS